MPDGVSGSHSSAPLYGQIAGLSAVKTDGQTQLTFVDKSKINPTTDRVLKLSPDVMQNKEQFQSALQSLDGNSGQDILQLPVLKGGQPTGQYVFVSLSALEGVGENAAGQDKRQQLIDSLMQQVENGQTDPTRRLSNVGLDLPSFITQGNNILGQSGGGVQVWFKPEQTTVTKTKTNIAAQDLSSITSLNDPQVTTLNNNVTQVVGGQVKTTDPNVTTLTPSQGFDLSSSQGREQVRTMLDGYLQGGGFNKALYNQVGPDGKPTQAALDYQKIVKQGIKNLIQGGASSVMPMLSPPPKNVDDFVNKFADTLFKDQNITANDVKLIQAGFAAAAETHPEFQNILSMPNPETGETPKNKGIDGVPATRFAVVTSTLFASLNKEVTVLKGTPAPPRINNYDRMATELGKDASTSIPNQIKTYKY